MEEDIPPMGARKVSQLPRAHAAEAVGDSLEGTTNPPPCSLYLEGKKVAARSAALISL